MICTIQPNEPPRLTLAQVHMGELFLVPGIDVLRHVVCALSLLVDRPVRTLKPGGLVHEAGAYFIRTESDSMRSVVVIACAAREGQAGYVPSGVEFDLSNDTGIVVMQQAEPMSVRVAQPKRLAAERTQGSEPAPGGEPLSIQEARSIVLSIIGCRTGAPIPPCTTPLTPDNRDAQASAPSRL